jgi:glucans biosynthesis protein
MIRTTVVAALLSAGFLIGTPDPARAQGAPPFEFETVVERARNLAAQPYQEPQAELPKALQDIDYDTFRKLRFRPEQALWRGERRFEVQFFHPGFLFRTPVAVHIVAAGKEFELAFNKTMFDYGDTGVDAEITGPLGFAGLRVHAPLNQVEYKDEVIVFLGASYFRVLGREQRYGLSARGLAVDTAMPRGEEFPRFRTFWLVTPEPEAGEMTLYALLDSTRVTGAYRFRFRPGTDTRVEVTARLIARAAIDKLGIAPLTSMHLFGENRSRAFDDHRPEVHDSDGLLMQTGSGRWLWRPLLNTRELQVSAFVDRDPRGFGLMQRDRAFDHYQDLEASYHGRPSYWIEPQGNWGEGHVELVEIPSNEEIHDNIVAFWRPNKPIQAGEEVELAYTLTATLREPPIHRLGKVVQTRLGSAVIPGTGGKANAERRLVVVDFDGGDLPLLPATLPVEADLAFTSGRVNDLQVIRIAETGQWRTSFRIDLEGSDVVELSLQLLLDGAPVTETWLYRLTQ